MSNTDSKKKLTAEEVFEQQRLKRNTDNITSNPDPDYNSLFYQEIFSLKKRMKT